MFKQSKSVQNRLLTTQHSQRSITINTLILNDVALRDKARMSMYNLYGQIDGNLGVIRMNREHRYNTLTSAMIDDINRGVNTFNQDHILHAIYLGTEKGQHWCNGTDFRTLAHMKKEDNYARIQEYMEKLYQMQTNIASMNKPIIAVAPGHAMNSGAAFLAATGHPMTTLDSKIAFNETTFGFVPHSGASYYMSRMKGEFGTFMALTGLSIHGSDAARIDISKGIVHNPVEYSQEVADHVSTLPYPEFGGEQVFEQQPKEAATYMTPWKDYIETRHQLKFQNKNVDGTRSRNQSMNVGSEIFDGTYTDPHERSPSSIGKANDRYMRYIRADADRNMPEEQGFLDYAQDAPNREQLFTYKNYYADTMHYIESRIGNQYPQINGNSVNHQELIDRCFYGHSVEEIMLNLRKETHPFAVECLKAMQRNSPQSMQLALSMLRKAQNLDYKGCLQMELNVAFHRIQDADFDLGVKSVLGAPKTKGAAHKTAPEWAKAFTEKEIEPYFNSNKYAEGIDLQIVENALLPTKHYYERFSDQVRLWINQQSTTQAKIREIFDLEAKHALLEQGIDTRDLALTPEVARNHLRAKLAQERVQEVQAERTEQLMCDQKLREEYFQKIQKELLKLDQSDKLFYKEVNKNVSGTFRDAYFERLDKVFKKSENAHNLEKRRMFIRMKKFYFKQRILQYGSENADRSLKQALAMPFQQIHLTEKWDESFRDGNKHPDLVKTPLWHVASAIGRVSLTAPEMAKTYLSDPAARSQLTMFTLDKEELQRLNTDLLENPEKYEMILQGDNLIEMENKLVFKNYRELQTPKQRETEYWFRMLNDGRCPQETLPYAMMFHDYRDWVELIESRAMDTLRAAINKLLIDHEQVTPHEGSLNKLIHLANQKLIPSKKTKSRKSPQKQLGLETRPLKEIEYNLDEMLRNDPNLGHLFPRTMNNNPKVKALQVEFKAELLKLIEVVLLDKHSSIVEDIDDRRDFERILAQLTNPTQRQEGQLNLIDQYLGRKNGEALVKDAFQMVAPFFLEQMRQRLQEECDTLLEQSKFDTIAGDLMVFYFLNQSFPNFKNNPVLLKWMNWSQDEEIHAHAQGLFPFLTEEFQRKEMQGMIGRAPLDRKNKTLDELKEESLEQTRKQLTDYKNFEEKFAVPVEHKVSTLEQREEHMYMSDMEIRELQQLQHYMCDIHEFLFDKKYEIDHHMTDFDKVKMIGDSICKYDLNMSALAGERSESEWDSTGEYAKFVTDMATGLRDARSRCEFDAIEFIETQDIDTLQAATFYHAARAERERLLSERDAEHSVDRHSVIKKSINNFNDLQNAVKQDSDKLERLGRLIEKQHPKTQQKLTSLIQSSQYYVDLDLMASKIRNKDFKFLQNPTEVMNVQKVLKIAKRKLVELDSAVDVLSLHQLKTQIQLSGSLETQDKLNLANIVDYVMDQTKYLSNEERKGLSVKDYLEKHHFTSHEAFQVYSSDLLKQKLDKMLGKAPEYSEDPIDWQVGKNRTMPSEHKINDSVEDVMARTVEKVHRTMMVSEIPEGLVTPEEVEIINNDKIFDFMDTYVPRSTEDLDSSEDEYTEDSDLEPYDETQVVEPIEYSEKGYAVQMEQNTLVEHTHPQTGVKEVDNLRDYMNKQVYREARELCELDKAMIPTKNLYEHQFLLQMIEPNYSEKRVQEVIEEYTDLRLKGLMLNQKFAKAMKSENAHLYLKFLREAVVQELGLGQAPEASDLSYQNITEEFKNQQFYDPENAYNMQSVNNEHALGFDNLTERAQQSTATQNFETAHETVFDQLLADYFLGKRGEYKESNKLLKDLSQIFEQENAFKHGGSAIDHLDQTDKLQNIGKNAEPRLRADTFRELIQLDVMSQRALQQNKNGLSTNLRALSITETEHPDFFTTQIPAYFEVFDVRKPADRYVKDKLMCVIRECFTVRSKLEKRMTRAELMAFDKVLARYLQKDKLLPKLKAAIEEDYNILHQQRTLINHSHDNEENRHVQGLKQNHDQRRLNKEVVDDNAQFKAIAMMAMSDRKYTKDVLTNGEVKEAVYNGETFEHYYYTQLKKDAKVAPRPVNPDDFKARKPWDKPVGTPFKNRITKEKELKEDHNVYQENKLEQQDRIQLFYVLEQFYEKARNEPDQKSNGQKLIAEYFADPENTFFFDKNKLV